MMKENFQICPVVKKYLILLSVCFCINATILAQIGKVGINTTVPAAMLHVKDSSVVFTGISPLPGSPGSPPVNGEGTRMMWYPDKAAFRVGNVSGAGQTFWNKDSIGLYSIAFGLNAKAKGFGSFAMGENTQALANYSYSLGNSTKAIGASSTSLGHSTQAIGSISTAMGFGTKASGEYSTAIGAFTKAIGDFSTTMGILTTAKPYASIVLGQYNDTTSISSTTWNLLDPIFIVGNGISDNALSNAITVLKNGRTGINTHDPKAMLHVRDSSILFTGSPNPFNNPGPPPMSGIGTRTMWYAGKGAFRTGWVGDNHWDENNVGIMSFAANESNIASGWGSSAFGCGTIASNMYAFCTGFFTEAHGENSFSMGRQTKANGYFSTAMGFRTTNSSYASLVIGRFNKIHPASSSSSWSPTDIAFVIGNGTTDTTRSNAVTILKNGKTGINIDIPLAMLHVKDSSVLFTGPTSLSGASNPPISGAGTRMMWYPDKAAFRAGRVTSSAWNNENIGDHSIAMGQNTEASGFASTAIGNTTKSSGSNATAMGSLTTASGFASTSMGISTNASGENAIAMGNTTTASGDNSMATGFYTKAIGNNATTFGHLVTAKPFASVVIGRFNDTTSISSTSWNVSDPVFIIGNGTATDARANAITVLKNGNTGLGTTAPERLLHVQSGSSGATSNSASVGVFERNGDVAINLLTPNADASSVYFGNVSHSAHGAIVYNSTTPNGFQFRTNGNSTKMVIADNGNVGIGTIAPTEKLHVVGDICYTGSIAACSDIRYKKNILPISNALSSLQFINGIYYNWDKIKFPDNEFGDERQIGFSAQELESIIPEVVHTDPNGFKSVDYSRLTPVLVEAIKEQQNMIASQQASLDSQQAKLESLEKELQEIRSILSEQHTVQRVTKL